MTKIIKKDEFLNFISGMPEYIEFEMMEKVVFSNPPVYVWTVNFNIGGLNIAEWKKEFDKRYEHYEHQEPNTNHSKVEISLTDDEE